MFEACLLQAALHRAQPAQLSIHLCFCKAKAAFLTKGSLAANLLPLPLSPKPTITTAFMSLCDDLEAHLT